MWSLETYNHGRLDSDVASHCILWQDSKGDGREDRALMRTELTATGDHKGTYCISWSLGSNVDREITSTSSRKSTGRVNEWFGRKPGMLLLNPELLHLFCGAEHQNSG